MIEIGLNVAFQTAFCHRAVTTSSVSLQPTLLRLEHRRKHFRGRRDAGRIAPEDERSERLMVDLAGCAAADADEGEAAQQFVRGKCVGNFLLDVDAVLDQQDDRGATDDGS